jgi:hypothetical protein
MKDVPQREIASRGFQYLMMFVFKNILEVLKINWRNFE